MKVIKNFIDGNWEVGHVTEYLDVINPSSGEIIGKVPVSSREPVDKAVIAASEAFKAWSEIPAVKRTRYLARLLELMNENYEELSKLISIDEGKNLVDARAEMKRAIENLEVAIGTPSLLSGEYLENIADGIDGYVFKQSMGVFAVICPFNFPLMVPFWFFPYALATGNTVIVKPSEQVPLCMDRIAELTCLAGFPRGIFNIIHGTKEVSEALVEHPGIAGVSFVGSTPVAKSVARKAAEYGKRYQCFGGAKNYFVVMPDANMEKVISSLMTSCYGCAGERCMAASVVVGVGEIYDEIKNKFIEAAKNLVIGNALDEKTDVGPVISKKAKERIIGLINKGIEEGATLLLDGRNIVVEGYENGFYVGPTIFENVTWDMEIMKTEIFGPVVCLVKTETFEEALCHMNSSKYGNGASIFTRSGYYAREFQRLARVGMVGINIGVPAPVALFPFGGEKQSMFGNIKAQSKGILDFFTTKKIVTSRFFE
ncbi:MAG: CoA-acylating methylmalonate-semialdehyde dehydrogenase [Clostridiaceae bacterium]|nr:CoA-acylating methylmalonate-semialdehyde dehydrogenase [Clostridiaceae bacterium]